MPAATAFSNTHNIALMIPNLAPNNLFPGTQKINSEINVFRHPKEAVDELGTYVLEIPQTDREKYSDNLFKRMQMFMDHLPKRHIVP